MRDLVEELRRKLLKHPRPTRLVVHTDGDSREVVVEKNVSWRELAESCLALKPEMVEVYTESGFNRAWKPTDGAPVERKVHEAPAPLHHDPETARLTHFSNLLSEAYRHANDVAFVKLAEIVEMVMDMHQATNQRLERVEMAYRNEQSQRLEDMWARVSEAAADGDDPQQSMLAALLQGFMSGQPPRSTPPRSTPPTPNGKKE